MNDNTDKLPAIEEIHSTKLGTRAQPSLIAHTHHNASKAMPANPRSAPSYPTFPEEAPAPVLLLEDVEAAVAVPLPELVAAEPVPVAEAEAEATLELPDPLCVWQ